MIKYFGTEIIKDVFFGNAAEFFQSRVTRGERKKENVFITVPGTAPLR